MSADFTDVTALTNGAKFVRGDLHIHSYGGSHDVGDTNATPAAIVATAQASDLKIIALADHNSIDNVGAAIAAADPALLLVVPAVELSTMQGHLLCYLPDLRSLERFYTGLTVRDFGLATSRVGESMLDCLEQLKNLNGFGVLAHVDGPKGLEVEMPGGSPHKSDILAHEALLGIELKNAASTISYGSADPDNIRRQMGNERNRRLGGTRSLARVLNSDSHTLAALGRNAAGDQRVTRYKLQSLSFASLKQALRDADARVRLEDELPRMVPVVAGMRFTGGFLRDQRVHLSPNLTCIIGGRGTGKSTTFEAIRCFSDNPSGQSVVNSDVWPERVDISFVDEVGSTHVLSWSHGDTCGTNITDPFEGPTTLPVECYGQGETQRISQRAQTDPGALLEYLDRFTDVASELAGEESERQKVADIESKIAEARLHVAKIPDQVRQLAITKQQIRRYKDGNAKSIIETYQQIEQERQARREILEQANEIAESLDYGTVRKALAKIKTAASSTTLKIGAEEFTAIKDSAERFESSLASSEADLKSKTAELGALVSAKVQAWSDKEGALLTLADTQRTALEAQGVQVNVAYIGELTQNEARYEADIVTLRAWEPYLAGLLSQRDTLTASRWAARGAIYDKRRAFASLASTRLRESLGDLNVTLKFEKNGHSPQGHDLLLEVMQWRTTQVARAPAIIRKLTIPKLIDAVIAKDPAPLQGLKTDEGVALFNRSEAQTILERFAEPSVMARLQTVQVFDRPYLTVTRAQEDESGTKTFKTREFAQLSLGQQQSVLLALMLSADNASPLLIDQPEDNLDGQFIFAQLVPAIRRAKERRQIVVVTHNPNIAVLGDAELVIVLGANNEQAVITSRGSIDDPTTKEVACKILEGARDAFVRRGQVYGVL